MTPLTLQDALVKELENILKPLKLKDKDGRPKHIAVYSQYLPVASSYSSPSVEAEGVGFDFQDFNGGYESLLPFIVVYLQDGVIQSGVMAHAINIGLAIGVYDNGDGRQGYRDVMLAISKIAERFEKNDILAGKFIAQFPMEWSLQEPDDITCPCFYGSLILKFNTLTYRKECIHA